MGLIREVRRRAGAVVWPTMAAVVVGYFLLHAFQGDRGILAWIQLRQKVEVAESDLATLTAKRVLLEARTAYLSSDTLEPDLLDEQVRRMTGLGRANEFVIYDDADTAPR